MLKLKSITPLGADEARVDRFTDLTITEVTERALVSLTARNDQADAIRDKARGLLGI
ncbi:MAG: sarcosine oxidase, gamma subunit, partial [Shimia sp.]|nr:sarcosine oxidase, gamma subunit [Shimia sp.]